MKWYMKCFIYWTADLKSSKLWSSQLGTQFKQLRTEAWKSQDFNGVWTRDLAISVRRSKHLTFSAVDFVQYANMGEVTWTGLERSEVRIRSCKLTLLRELTKYGTEIYLSASLSRDQHLSPLTVTADFLLFLLFCFVLVYHSLFKAYAYYMKHTEILLKELQKNLKSEKKFIFKVVFFNRQYSYSQYWTGTSFQWRLMREKLFKCK